MNLSVASVAALAMRLAEIHLQNGGIFNLLLSLKSNVAEVADIGVRAERYADIFNRIDVIRHPLMLPQSMGVLNWPEGGEGLEPVQVNLLINLPALFSTGLNCPAIVLVYRQIVLKTKCFNSFKLVFVESDVAFEDGDGNLPKRRHYDSQPQVDLVSDPDAVTPAYSSSLD
ncbi:unnamed protein product [Taenia asiatica]|uniref:Uncharacterized protein n=1 Tax=Taenia asiatica TaxID=60517 RepID=A0A0R3W1T6_TAEAS|nr:unnamed protein product [Taenia asiatica]